MKSKLIFILWLLMFSFFSCDFGIKENEETNSKEYFTVKGSCSIQGAIPSDLLPEKSIKQNAQRTVVPEIGRTYEITVSFESETGDTKSVEVVDKDGVLNFEVELPPGKWTVKAQGKKDDVVIIKSESCQIELSAENKSENVALVLKPTQSDTGEGFFEFSFGTNYNKVLGMKYTYEKHGATESPQTGKIDDFSDKENINLSSGVYTFRFDFYSDKKCTGELLYSFTEVVNIFDGLTTDTWIGAGEYIEDGKICITDTMISQFVSTTVYVSNDGNDSNLGTFFEPVKTIQQAVDKVIDMNVVTASSEENPYKILLLSDIYTPSNNSFENINKALVNIDPSSASGNPLYLTISKYGDGNATINAERDEFQPGRVMYIGENANVTLQKLILKGGHLKDDNGAGLYILNNNANVKIEKSEISENVIDNGYGAGLHVGDQATKRLNLTIENSKISSNTINHYDRIVEYYGAGIFIENVAVTLTITNSEINSNKINQERIAITPGDKGVGLWLGNSAVTTISDSTISGNKFDKAASTNKNAGGGVYIAGGTFNMNGGAVISSDNDVYLANGTTITVTGNLTSTDTVATITPNEYSPDRQVLVAGSGVNFTDKIVNRFLVTPKNSNEWYVTVNGNLQNMEKDAYGYYLGREPKDMSTTPETVYTEEGDVELTKVSGSIESYDNMLWIAHKLKEAAMTENKISFNIKLTKDIEIPSGKWQFSELNADYSTIDGQGYSITIEEDVSTFGNGAGGLFYKFNNSTVKNLVLKGRITANTSIIVNTNEGSYIGALCRSAYGSIFENIMSEVTITDKGFGFAGGLIGRLGTNVRNDASKAMVKNCAVYADVSSTNGIAGGILGAIWDNTRCCTIQNSIYMGEIIGTTVGAIAGRNGNNDSAKSVLNNIWYCVTNNTSIPLIGTKADTTTEDINAVDSKTTDDIATPAAANLLNTDSDETDNYVWKFDSGSAYPTLKTRSSE